MLRVEGMSESCVEICRRERRVSSGEDMPAYIAKLNFVKVSWQSLSVCIQMSSFTKGYSGSEEEGLIKPGRVGLICIRIIVI